MSVHNVGLDCKNMVHHAKNMPLVKREFLTRSVGITLKTNLILGVAELGNQYKICVLNCFFEEEKWDCLNSCENLMGLTE